METVDFKASRAPELSCYLRFASLFNPGKAVVVPCDEGGKVDLDNLPEKLRTAYLGARALVGRDYACPVVDHLH